MNKTIISNNTDLAGDVTVKLFDQTLCLFCHKYLFECKCPKEICVCYFPESGELCTIHNDMNKENRGGAREGAGRPKSKPTKTLSYRVPEKLAAKIDKAIRKIIKSTK